MHLNFHRNYKGQKVVTIFFAVKLVKAELPTWLDWVLVAYVAFYVFMHLVFSTSNVAGYSMGAPSSSCDSMVPGHLSTPRTSLSPYSLRLTSTGKKDPNGKREVGVRLASPHDIAFKGFLVQALAHGTGEPIGKFIIEDNNKAKLLSCGKGLDNSVTHPNGKGKRFVNLVWEAPDDYDGIVVFNSTFVQDKETYWVGVTSDPLKITKRSTGNDTYDSGVSTLRPPPTRPPTRVRPTQPSSDSFTTKPPALGTSFESKKYEDIYEGCATTQLCFGMPRNCISDKNCNTLVTIAVAGNQYEFEMLALPVEGEPKYVAVGLSSDDKMGEDSVVECALEPSGTVNLYTSYNEGRSNTRNPSKNGVSLVSSSYEDQVIRCKFTREVNTVSGGREYDLVNDKFCILLAAGNTLKENSVGYHFGRRDFTASPQHLSDVREIKGASKLLLRLHGAFMVAAWLLCASTGILLARYFKRTWTGSQTCGKDQWFAWHRMIMLLAWALTVAGFVIIFVELGEWSTTADLHAVLGTITTALATIQPIMAAFRPAPTGKRRPMFNWAHWFVGNAAHILAVVTIFFAVKLVKAELPTWLDWVLVAYYSCLRKLLLALYIVGILALTIAIIVIVVLAPIAENWDHVTKVFT
ncbi:hypothetical protein J437_LFUL007034 [Ladona fulva]|uniref:Ferric-chelate reductase 1 n=1 Tax=Ladona fulva TaxID=123851 RepID=A0A8K0K4Q2_LADFU|nr:hypothetical protein J437_LFUL007034 [Ladona fulva]